MNKGNVRKGNARGYDPLHSPLSPNKSGGNYGERQKLNRIKAMQTKPVAKRPVDKFSNNNVDTRNAHLFKPGKYTAGRRLTAGTPHRVPKLHRLQTGTLQKPILNASAKASIIKKPTDRAILNFLEKIITT